MIPWSVTDPTLLDRSIPFKTMQWFKAVYLMLQTIKPSGDKDYGTVWAPVVAELYAAKLHGSGNDPTWTTFKDGTGAYSFSGSALNELDFTLTIPHTYRAGALVKPFVQWAHSTTDVADVGWGLEYTIVAPDGTFVATSTLTATVTPDGTAWKHYRTSLGNIDAANLKEGSVLVGRVYRPAGDASTVDVFGFNIGLALGAEKIGSATEAP